MSLARYRGRLESKFHRTCAERLFRQPFAVPGRVPVISFTFDDFPRTALSAGGTILEKHGARGTYYVSLDLAGKQDSAGEMFTLEDLKATHARGHELGCHTFAHCDSSGTRSSEFLESVRANQRALDAFFPGEKFRTFSYPKSAPRGRTKQLVAQRFGCCRGGGQTFNTGVTDLNYLRAYFLEQAHGDTGSILEMIDANKNAKGWLIFATHDVCANPSPYGVTPELFETVVEAAVRSGAKILPVTEALASLRSH